VPTQMIQPLKEFDWLTLWRSVDESADSPMHNADTYNRFKQWTSDKCKHESGFSLYIQEVIDSYSGKWISKKDIYDNGYLLNGKDHKLNWGNFKEKCEKSGLIFRRQNQGMGFYVPEQMDIIVADKENF